MAGLVLLALVSAGGWFVGRALIPDRQTAGGETSSSAPVAVGAAFNVETPAFHFVMPDTPTTERISSDVIGLDVASTAWTIESDGIVLQVMAFEFPTPLDDDMAQAAFDAMIGGMKRRAEGTVVLDEEFRTDGISGRRSVIEAAGVRFFTENYAHGIWIVSIVAGNSGAVPPASYTDLIASFSFDVAPTGDTFTDPQRTYTMAIDDEWTDTSGGFVAEVESWIIAPPHDGFAANVNVLTQSAQGMDLAQYMELSMRQMGGYELIGQATVEGTNGNTLGVLEYSGVAPGGPDDRPLHFLATVDVLDGRAIVATFTAEEASFDEQRANAEPYLLTLQAT